MDKESFEASIAELESSPNLRMKSLIVTSPGAIYRYSFNRSATPTDLRSISKLVVSIVLGIAMESGMRLRGEPLSLDMKISPFFAKFSGRLDAPSRSNFSEVRLRHLLNNTMGHRNGFLFRKDVRAQDPDFLLDYIFSQPIEFKPGSYFSYSNVGWYLVSAMITNELGVPLSQWISQLFLEKIGVSEFDWVKYGAYDAAATGLSLGSGDVHKLGELLIADGKYRNVQAVPRAWLETIRGPVVKASSGYDPSSPLQATAYGYGIWVCDDGTYYCDGSGGQFIIVVPHKGLVISALTEDGDTLTVSRCLRRIL